MLPAQLGQPGVVIPFGYLAQLTSASEPATKLTVLKALM